MRSIIEVSAKTYIPVLMASTGSNFDAEIAGITPEIRPMPVESAKPKKILKEGQYKGKILYQRVSSQRHKPNQ